MAEPLIISNTTPLINFAEIGRMDVLEALFTKLVIPPAVVSELTDKRSLFPLAAQVPSLDFISVIAPKDQPWSRSLGAQLHPGEAESLVLALENLGSLLLLDDLAAREFAASNALLYTGTLGCLAEAKKRGLIAKVAPLMQDLRSKAHFWIADHLEDRILRQTGER